LNPRPPRDRGCGARCKGRERVLVGSEDENAGSAVARRNLAFGAVSCRFARVYVLRSQILQLLLDRLFRRYAAQGQRLRLCQFVGHWRGSSNRLVGLFKCLNGDSQLLDLLSTVELLITLIWMHMSMDDTLGSIEANSLFSPNVAVCFLRYRSMLLTLLSARVVSIVLSLSMSNPTKSPSLRTDSWLRFVYS
jgi:hypothetical protein